MYLSRMKNEPRAINFVHNSFSIVVRNHKFVCFFWVSCSVCPQDSITKLVRAQCQPRFSATCSPNSFFRRLFILRILPTYLMTSYFKVFKLRWQIFRKQAMSYPASKSKLKISLINLIFANYSFDNRLLKIERSLKSSKNCS